jgi:tryptophanyl-tRNA synthetase
MRELRQAVGLRKLVAVTAPAAKHKAAKAAQPSFKQYREADGQFYFKMLSSEGKLLLQSRAYAIPKEAALAIAALQQQGEQALTSLAEQLQPLEGVQPEEVVSALRQLLAALTST